MVYSVKRPKAITIILLAMLSASILSSETYRAYGQTVVPVVDVERSVKVLNGGVLILEDLYTLSAPGGSEVLISEFWIGSSDTFTPERSTFEIWKSGSWNRIQALPQVIQNERGSIFELAVPITLRTGTSMRFKTSYLALDSVGGTGSSYAIVLPFFPIIDYNISQYQMDVELPPDAIFERVASPINMTQNEIDDRWNINYEGENIPAHSKVFASIFFTHSPEDDLIMVVENVSRSITIKSSSLLIEDTYAITNKGPVIAKFPLELPLDASNIKARDGVGPILTRIMDSNWSKEVTVFNRSPVKPGDRWVFTISYTTDTDNYVSTAGGSSHIAYPNINLPHFIRELNITVSINESDIVGLTYTDTLLSERPTIGTEIPPGSLTPSLRLIAIIAGLGLVVAVIVFRKRLEKSAQNKRDTKVDSPNLKEFVKKQRERINLLKALGSLEEEKGEKDEYARLVAEYNLGISKLSKYLKHLAVTLTDVPELSEALREMKNVEEELTRITTDLKSLKVRLRTRRVSKGDYERRKRDRIHRRALAIKKMEKALESLGG
jgi:hypothetical protein